VEGNASSLPLGDSANPDLTSANNRVFPVHTQAQKNPPCQAGFKKKRKRQTRLVLDFAVQCMTTKKLVIFLFFDAIWLLLFIAASHIAGYWFALGACLSAFDHYVLSCHTKNSLLDLKKGRKLVASDAEATLFSSEFQ
tara:strand:+ start:1741 stop:2154 length:414 start_codon:yes stop_codon:yes gene_type:complete